MSRVGDRMTKAELFPVFRLFLRAYALKESKAWDQPGYCLDRYAAEGQSLWKVIRIVKSKISDTWIEEDPYGSRRRTTREMYECLHFAISIQGRLV